MCLIYQWYVNGDENGKRLSAGAIAKRLSEMKIPTPGETNPGYHRKRDSGMWHAFGVIEIISREVSAGIWRYGVRIGATRNQRPEEEWIVVEVPPLVDRELWDKAQEQRQLNKQFSRRNAQHDYLLSGMIRCACGRAMSGEFFSDHQYYTCGWRNNHHPEMEERTCFARSVRADAVEVDVWESIEGLFSDLNKLEHHLRLAQKEELEAINPKIEELNAVESMIASTEQEAVEIGQALRRATGLVARSIEQNMAEVNMRYEALCKRRDELTEDLSMTRLTDTAIEELLQFAQDISIGIENADFETKRRNLQLLKVRVTVDKGMFTINCIAGVITGELRKLPRAPNGGIASDSRSQARALPGCRFRADRLRPGRLCLQIRAGQGG